MDNCIFCKIVQGKLSTEIIGENEHCIAVEDLTPQAPSHVLVLLKDHVPNLSATQPDHAVKLGHMLLLAGQLGPKSGYRTIVNTGEDSRGTINHLHMHVLSGRDLGDMVNV